MGVGEYWIVNQILSKELHHGDNETMTYTLTLMDKLEQVRQKLGLGIAYTEKIRSKRITQPTMLS